MEKNSNPRKSIKVFVFCYLLFVICFLLWSEIYLPLKPNSNRVVNFAVEKGMGAKQISIKLKEEKIIKNIFFFRAYVSVRGLSKKLQAGEYELSPVMSISKIVRKISSGDVIKEKITIIEGWNLKDMGKYFEEQKICTEEEFSELVKKDFSQDFDVLLDKPQKMNLEGYLFPDTYEIIPGTAMEGVIKKILSNLKEKLTPDLRQEIAKQKKTIFEIITMASIIEKEVKTLEDKKIVSGIFWKRIKIGQPLQSCATINYITGKNDPGALFEDIKIDSPYNTYKYYGLPIGPICSPGLDSIIAAIYPQETDYLYYLSTPEGETIFSKTLKDHNRARNAIKSQL